MLPFRFKGDVVKNAHVKVAVAVIDGPDLSEDFSADRSLEKICKSFRGRKRQTKTRIKFVLH